MHEPGCVHCPPTPPFFFFFLTKLISKHKTRCTIKMSRTLVCCSKRLTSVSGVGSFRVPTALLLLHMWRQRGLCCLPSLLCQSKQTCLSETVTGHLLHACAHVKLHDVTTLHPCPVTVFFLNIYQRGLQTANQLLLRNNYWRIPIKTGSSHGSETTRTTRVSTMGQNMSKQRETTAASRCHITNVIYLLPSVEETLLLGAHVEDVLYFQPQRLNFGQSRKILHGSRHLPVYSTNLDPHRCTSPLSLEFMSNRAVLAADTACSQGWMFFKNWQCLGLHCVCLCRGNVGVARAGGVSHEVAAPSKSRDIYVWGGENVSLLKV